MPSIAGARRPLFCVSQRPLRRGSGPGNLGGVRAVGIAFIVAVSLMSFALAGCSSEAGDSDPAPTTVEVSARSFACIQAISSTGLATGSSVERARTNLRKLADDESISAAERRYFTELLAAIEGKADNDSIGNSLNGVSCQLK